jgi:hypothetical protein
MPQAGLGPWPSLRRWKPWRQVPALLHLMVALCMVPTVPTYADPPAAGNPDFVAHPRPATANAEPGPHNAQRRPKDQVDDYDITRPAATRPALGAASRVRPEPLKPGLPTPHNA